MKNLIFSLIIGFASAAYYSDKPCPVRPVIKNFNVVDMAGGWYEIKKYSTVYNQGFDCSFTFQNITGEKTIEPTRCEKIDGTRSCIKYRGVQNGNDGSYSAYDFDGSKFKTFEK
jgi:hypothetical protein